MQNRVTIGTHCGTVGSGGLGRGEGPRTGRRMQGSQSGTGGPQEGLQYTDEFLHFLVSRAETKARGCCLMRWSRPESSCVRNDGGVVCAVEQARGQGGKGSWTSRSSQDAADLVIKVRVVGGGTR